MSLPSLPRYVLDTNIISALVHGRSSTNHRFNQQARANATFLLCPLVWYEMRRGLLRQRTTRKLQVFDQLATTFLWQDFEAEDWHLAVLAWPKMVEIGQMPSDADLLIAVFAARRNAILVTQNQKHFQPLTAYLPLQLEDWT
jgi:predicted nucleic acid-binding protein